MKALKLQAQQWEEEQFLQLIYFYKQILKFINVSIFISYQLIKLLFNLIRIALLSETNVRVLRDEQWIYRQIK